MQNAEKTPELSIIVPIYKVEKYLDECIQSILGQTFTDFELILVDDGSPDACPQMCDAAAEQDSRVRVIHQKNGGLSAARNTGIEAARGNWLGFVDSDDFVAPDFYEKLYNAAVNADADCAVCSVQLTHEDGSWMDTPPQWKVYGGGYTGEDVLKTITWQNNAPYLVAWNKLYRREVFRTLRYPVGRINEDVFVFAELFDTIKKVACVEQPLYFYRQRKDSIMQSKCTLRNLDEMWSFVHCFECFQRSGRMEMLPFVESRVFAKLTGVYYRLSAQEQHSDAMRQAMAAQKKAAKLLRQQGMLTKKAALRTMLFQTFPVVYGLRRKCPK